MRILLAGILCEIAMFLWTSLAHMALPLGEAGINEIPNESPVLSAMQSSIGDKTDAMKQRQQRIAANPSGTFGMPPRPTRKSYVSGLTPATKYLGSAT